MVAKSCTTQDDWNPLSNEINHYSPQDFFHLEFLILHGLAVQAGSGLFLSNRMKQISCDVSAEELLWMPTERNRIGEMPACCFSNFLEHGQWWADFCPIGDMLVWPSWKDRCCLKPEIISGEAERPICKWWSRCHWVLGMTIEERRQIWDDHWGWMGFLRLGGCLCFPCGWNMLEHGCFGHSKMEKVECDRMWWTKWDFLGLSL